MNATVQKWGNSLALRIPIAVAKDIQLRRGSAVELAVEEGRIVVTPVKKKKSSLSDLLKHVTDGNRPGERDWGAPIGKEVW